MKNITLLLSVSVLAACDSSSHGTTIDAPDHVADAAPPKPPRALIVSGDFTPGDPGIMATIDPETRAVTKMAAPQGAVGDDPMLRHLGHEIAIINRNDSSNITILDDQTLALVGQFSTGTASNPQDVAFAGTKLYVPTFLGKGVVTIDRDSMAMTEIDLGADDPDGKPNCESIFALGGKLYVACGLLDDTMMYKPPRGPGKIYVIDPATDHQVAAITLTTNNPIGYLEASTATAGGLVVPTMDFGTGIGCVEHVPTDGSTTTACIVQNSSLGGFAYASRVDFRGSGGSAEMLMAVADYPMGSMQGYDYATQAMFPSPLTPSTEVIGDAVVCPGDRYFVTDQTMDASGVRERDATSELTTAPLDVGLKPNSTHGLICY